MFSTHTRAQGTCKEHNKSLASLALCLTSLVHKGCLITGHLAYKAGPRPVLQLLLCLKDLLTGKCLLPFHPKQEAPDTVWRTGIAWLFAGSPPLWRCSLGMIVLGRLLSRKAAGTGCQRHLPWGGDGAVTRLQLPVALGTKRLSLQLSFFQQTLTKHSVPPGRHRKVLDKVFELRKFTGKPERLHQTSHLFIHM